MVKLLEDYPMKYYMHSQEPQPSIELLESSLKNKSYYGTKYFNFKRKVVLSVVERKEIQPLKKWDL